MMIEDLQKQVAELIQRLAARDFKDLVISDRNSESTFENPYHHRTTYWEHRSWEEQYRDFGFWVDLPGFFGTLQAEGFIDWLNEVERIFKYKYLIKSK